MTRPPISTRDRAVWDALLSGRPCPLPPAEWRRYLRQLRREARGYWHGATGRLFERARLPPEEWELLRDVFAARPPECLGDSSLDELEVMMSDRADAYRRRWLR